MANIEAEKNQWEFCYFFRNSEGQPIVCGKPNCTIGSYILSQEAQMTLTAPACATCEFSGNLGDVFNPDEPRYEPGAPESFKRAAALIMTTNPDSGIDAIRSGRPDTAALIEAYAVKPTS